MRKPYCFVAVAFMFCILLLSCKTTEAVSDEQIIVALLQAGDMAVDNAFNDILYHDLDSLDYTPPEVAFIEAQESIIPGMTFLLGQWKDSAIKNCKDNIFEYPLYFKEAIENLNITNPQSMRNINTSVTDLLESTMYEQIHAMILRRVNENFDDSEFQKIIDQYNDFLTTESLFSRVASQLVVIDVKPYLATLITDLIFQRLAASETRVRTTPDLSLDSSFVKVFNLGF